MGNGIVGTALAFQAPHSVCTPNMGGKCSRSESLEADIAKIEADKRLASLPWMQLTLEVGEMAEVSKASVKGPEIVRPRRGSAACRWCRHQC